jgi:hypothetical protein
MLKVLVCFIVLITTISVGYPQMYGNALGIRLGNSPDFRSVGLTYQQRIAKRLTVEGIVQSDFHQSTTIHGMIQKHEPILSRRFNYYFGTGFSLGNEFSGKTIINPSGQVVASSNATLGIDLLAGVELTMLKYTVSLDYKPNINIAGRDEWFQGQVGISLRAVLLSGREYDKKIRQRDREIRKESRESRRESRKQKVRNLLNKS